MKITPQQLHIPVLLAQVLDLLAPKNHEKYLDLTAGYGGHAREIISRIGGENSADFSAKNFEENLKNGAKFATLVDRDEFAISKLREEFSDFGAKIIHSDFKSAVKNLARENEKFDMILLDLGVSSVQFDFKNRGFSFSENAPLDMRMDISQNLTAREIVNKYSEEKLKKIFTEFGEEKAGISAKVAREIVKIRAKNPIENTEDLANLILKIVGKSDRGKWHKIHPATKIFQAIRIETNDELNQLRETLEILPKILNPGGRIAIISFHSLEDRIVKNFFKDNDFSADFENEFQILTKHPISGFDDENNPRARSAKLRAAAKINKNRKE